MEKETENKIIQYLRNNPKSSIHKIAKGLDLSELLVLKTVNGLCEQGLLTLIPLPLGNSIDRDCSAFYSAR